MTHLDDSLLTLLAESDLDDETELGDLLADLKALGTGPAPMPSAAVNALLAGSGSFGSARRGRHSRRGLIVGVLVLASIGTGVTAAAADPDLRAGAAGAVAAVVEVVHPHPAAAAPGHDAKAVVVPAAEPSHAASHESDPAAAPAVPVVPRHTPQVAGPVVRTGDPGDAREHGIPVGREDGGSGSGATNPSHGSGGSTDSGDDGSEGGSGDGGRGGRDSGSAGSGSDSGGTGGSDDGSGGSGSGSGDD